MDTQAQNVFDAALKLPADAREDLAIRLLSSAEPTEAEAKEINRAWEAEIEGRVARLESGESTAVPIEQAWPAVAGRPWRSQATGDE